MNHELKILEKFAKLHAKGVKDWELRKHDRDFKVGDTITFNVIDDEKKVIYKYTRAITNIYTGGEYGLSEEYCILSITKPAKYPLIKSISIQDPPRHYDKYYKKAKYDDRTGKYIQKKRFYLTGNMFFGNSFESNEVMNWAKRYIFPALESVPKLDKLGIEVIYCSPDDGYDLDNKSYFWVKIILDILKTPSDKQQINAATKGKKILTTDSIKDDCVRFVDDIKFRYERKQGHKLIVNIYGIKTNEQATLF